MAADATMTPGTSLVAGQRPDLAVAMSRYLDEYGLGPNSHYVALQAFGKMNVTGPGELSIDQTGWVYDADSANKSSERGMGLNPPQSDPGTIAKYYVRPAERGQIVRWDELDPNAQRRAALQGAMANETIYTAQSLNRCLQAIEAKAAGILCAVSTPFGAADVSATSAKWSTAASSIRAQFAEAEIKYDGQLDSMVLSRKAWAYLKMNTSLTGTYTGAVAEGTISDERARNIMAGFGIRNIFVGATAIWDDFVILYRRGTGDPETSFCGAVNVMQPGAGADANGLVYTSWDEPHGRIHNYYVYGVHDFVAFSEGGVRITDVY